MEGVSTPISSGSTGSCWRSTCCSPRRLVTRGALCLLPAASADSRGGGTFCQGHRFGFPRMDHHGYPAGFERAHSRGGACRRDFEFGFGLGGLPPRVKSTAARYPRHHHRHGHFHSARAVGASGSLQHSRRAGRHHDRRSGRMASENQFCMALSDHVFAHALVRYRARPENTGPAGDVVRSSDFEKKFTSAAKVLSPNFSIDTLRP